MRSNKGIDKFEEEGLAEQIADHGAGVFKVDDGIRRDAAKLVDRTAVRGLEFAPQTVRYGGKDAILVPVHIVDFLDTSSARRVVAGGRNLQLRPKVQRKYRLHQSFAEGPRTDDQRPIDILQRPRNNFARACAPAIGKDDHRGCLQERLFGGDVRFVGFRPASFCTHNFRPFGDKFADNVHGGIQKPAGIPPQIEDDTLDLAFDLQLLDRLVDLVPRLSRESFQPDVADPIVNEINVRHVLYLDLLADQGEVERFGDSFPFDDQADLRSRFAAGQHTDFIRLLGSHRYPVDLQKPVSRLDSRPLR